MKRTLMISPLLLAVVLLSTFSACAQKKQTILEEKIKVFFHCPNGKALIEKELVKEPGVTEVYADLESKVVTIKYVKGETDKDKLVAAIEKIGYKTEFTKEGTQINKACSHDPGGEEK